MPSNSVEVDHDLAVQPKKRKMRPGGGKQKGNGFEGTVAKTLSKALAPLNFIRTPGSGARVGGKNFETIGKMFGEDALKIFVGDVVPVNERQEGVRFGHVIECKAYATTDNFTSLVSGNANVFKWFEEAVIDAAKLNKNPLLICKWNHTPVFAVTEMRAPINPAVTLTTYSAQPRTLNVFLLGELLKVKEFWYVKS